MSNEKMNEIKEKISPLLKSKGFTFAGIFGSFARGEDKENSDIDILVRVPGDRKFSFIDLIKTEDELSIILKKKVDLVTENGVSPHMKNYIINDLKVIYG